MKKKVLCLGIIFLFLSSGMFSIISIAEKVNISNENDNDNNFEVIISENYPDLVVTSKYWLEKDPNWPTYRYFFEFEFINIGTDIAVKPLGYPLFKWYTKWSDGKITEDCKGNTSEIKILPGESLIIDKYVAPFIFGYGSQHIITIDPENIINEGEEGEKNNVHEFIITKSRNFVNQNNKNHNYKSTPLQKNRIHNQFDSKIEVGINRSDILFGIYINFIRGEVKSVYKDEDGYWAFDCIDMYSNCFAFAIPGGMIIRSYHIINELAIFPQCPEAMFYGDMTPPKIFGFLYWRT